MGLGQIQPTCQMARPDPQLELVPVGHIYTPPYVWQFLDQLLCAREIEGELPNTLNILEYKNLL